MLPMPISWNTRSIGSCKHMGWHYLDWKTGHIKESTYIALYTVLGLKYFTLHPLASQHHLNFSGKHSATLHLLCEYNSSTYPPLAVARYSCSYTAE